MKTLIRLETLIQNKIYNVTKYSFLFFIFCSLNITLINTAENIQNFAIIFSVISIPLVFIGLSNHLIKPDIEDGTLENLLTTFLPIKIILAKYIALCACCISSFIMTMPFMYIMYNIEVDILIFIIASALNLLLLSAALIVLIASIQGYFRSNTNFLAIVIMPLLIPSTILSGILLQNMQDIYLLFIMVGINMIIIPPSLYLSSYLIENIYNR